MYHYDAIYTLQPPLAPSQKLGVYNMFIHPLFSKNVHLHDSFTVG